MSEQSLISFVDSPGALRLTDATVLVDENDFLGVHHAARDLASDLSKVTGRELVPHRAVSGDGANDGVLPRTAIIIGCVESSPLVQTLVKAKIIAVDEIQGKWESFITVLVDNPLPGCERALVIAGSDKRGAIFGAYTVSEQIGVSPYGAIS
jgi:hypothetical protein